MTFAEWLEAGQPRDHILEHKDGGNCFFAMPGPESWLFGVNATAYAWYMSQTHRDGLAAEAEAKQLAADPNYVYRHFAAEIVAYMIKRRLT